MSLIDTINNILNTNLYQSNLKYCLVNSDKRPFKIDSTPARPNSEEDFVTIDYIISNLNNDINNNFAGIGISIQANKICAIDVDHCFSIPFNIESGDQRSKDIIRRFKDFAYIEFSFSGTGLRVLFKENVIENYTDLYYIKNKNNSVEYYQPSDSYRYVTVTGKCICNNQIKYCDESKEVLQMFLNDYMLRPVKQVEKIETIDTEDRSFEQLSKLVRGRYLKDINFQNLWFNPAPGSGKDESERDYHLVAYLYQYITQSQDLIQQLFESSPFFKTKDFKHVCKWTRQNNKYFKYLYDNIRRNYE